jgi:hypothetical protein
MGGIQAHFRQNVIGYVALFLSLTLGTAWALENNSVRSRHIVNNEIRSADLADGSIEPADLAPNSIGAGQVASDALGAGQIAPDAVGFSELDAAAFNADIAEQGAAFGIPNNGIQGFEVEDETLTGSDVDESTLTVVEGQGDAACCWLRSEVLDTDDPYSAADPRTFTGGLGFYELRSTAAGDAGVINICNNGGVNLAASDIVYVGGTSASTGDTRSRTSLPFDDACRSLDVNGAQTDGAGDFRMWLAENGNTEEVYVTGASLGPNGEFTIFAMTSPGFAD